MKQFLLILLSVSLAATVNSQSILDKVKKKLNTNSGLTEEEAGRGVKEALNNGIGSAVSFLNKPDAFFKSELYKVLLPPDAKKLVTGGKNSITEFFRSKTSVKLKEAFMPVINKSLEKTNATKYYGDAVTRYNKVPFVKKMNPDMADYVSDRTLFALFDRIAVEEVNIRSNPAARTSDLL